jgi:hypothetical protein
VQARGSSRRDVACCESYKEDEESGRNEHQRVADAKTINQARFDLRQGCGSDEAEERTESDQARTASHYETEHLGCAGAQRHANAELASSL